MTLETFSNWIVDGCSALLSALPANCSLCGQICPGTSLCDRCIDVLPYPGSVCRRCGLDFSNTDSETDEATDNHAGEAIGGMLKGQVACAYCAVHNPAVLRSLSLLRYEAPADRLISGFKYHRQFADGKTLATLLARKIMTQYAGTELPELVIPVPLHLSRWRHRGFNQALEISKTLGRHCSIELAPRLIVRTRKTLPQTEMTSASARRRNLSRAFSLIDAGSLAGVSRVAVVDDVITTMATINAVAKCLQAAGVEEVHAWSLARASR